MFYAGNKAPGISTRDGIDKDILKKIKKGEVAIKADKDGKAFVASAEDGKPRMQKADDASKADDRELALRDAVVGRMQKAGMDVSMDPEEGQRVLDMANEKDAGVRLQAKLSALAKAASAIRNWLAGDKRGKTFTIELPSATQRMVRKAMGRDFDSHNITANGIAHAKKNHGVNGNKLNENSIPLRDKDFELMPYIMTAPDYVRKGTSDVTGRESIRFYKNLGNGYVVVAEKEYKNSPDDMETITMWAEMSSSEATNARRNAPDTHVRNAILSTEDAAKIRKDAETAIQNDMKVSEQRVYHGSAAYFDRFDHSHMGEGEGAQAYGWGTYVTEVEGIGRTYAKQASYGRSLNISNLESRISMAEQRLPFERGDAKEEDLRDIAQWKQELERLKNEPVEQHLYTVEIPDDTGENYISWNDPLTDKQLDTIQVGLLHLMQSPAIPERLKEKLLAWNNGYVPVINIRKGETGEQAYEAIKNVVFDEYASKFLATLGFIGIKYPADNRRGGREDGKKNYVIFNEKDAKITDHVRFFRTRDGEAYGFTVGGKIYIDPRIANSETPVHEYAHLWATALRKGNAKEWQNVVGLMKGTKVWDEVKKRYPELKGDDEIADEVLATYSGRRGAERLREEARKIEDGDGSVTEKAEAVGVLERVRMALSKFWKAVADFLHIHYTSAEEVADRVMKDLMDGVDPRKFGVDEKKRKQFIGERGAVNADRTEEVNTRLDNLRVAREMETEKKDAKAIKMATGWERGADGKWRYEISDVKLKVGWREKAERVQGVSLSEIVDNKELFAYYPQLKDVTVNVEELHEGVYGKFDQSSNSINISNKILVGADSVIAHEVQHAIQRIEGFARGGNLKSAMLYLDANKTKDVEIKTNLFYEAAQKKNLGITKSEAENLVHHLEYEDLSDEELQKQIDELCEKHNITEDELEDIYPMNASDEAYRRIAGEVEARNVQNRMKMTPEERRQSLASETEDVARKDQIFLNGTDGVNDMVEKNYEGENESKELERVNERFNSELTRYKNGNMDKNEMLHLGKPQGVMRQFLPDLPIVMRQRILKKGSVKKHNVDVEALANMPQHLSSPIFVFQRSDNALGVLTEMQDRDGKNVCVAIELNRKIQEGGEILEVNDIRSVHGRNVADIIFPVIQNETLKWADKEKGLAYLSSASQYVQQEIDKQDLNDVTKVVENFENPKVLSENITENDKNTDDGVHFHKVEDKAELEKLEKEKTFRMYSGMQEVDGKLYSPMAAIIGGKRTDATEMGSWMKADERPDLVKNGKFNLVKTDGKKGLGEGDVPAAYNPYMHTSTSVMNDQFTGAYARGNIKVVEWEIPESEKTSGYHAEGAKNSVGLVPWHSGSVNSLLPKDRQRQVMLSQYRKAVRVVPDSEVAEKIAAQLDGTGLAIPWNTVTPNQLRELAKLDVPITTVETGKQAPETKRQFEEQKAELEKEFPQARFVDVQMTKSAYKEWGKNGGTGFSMERGNDGRHAENNASYTPDEGKRFRMGSPLLADGKERKEQERMLAGE